MIEKTTTENAESCKVPKSVLAQVQASVGLLREIEQRISGAKDLERRVGGNGRYVRETMENRQRDVESARRTLTTFRQHAPANDVDAEKVIAECGGEPVLPSLPGEESTEG